MIELYPLYKGLKQLPDKPDPTDKMSMFNAKQLIRYFAYEGLPIPEKLQAYINMDEVLTAKPPEEMLKKLEDDEFKAMAKNIKILQQCCGMSRDKAYEEAIKRGKLHIEISSLIRKISSKYPVRPGTARLEGKKLMEAFDLDPDGLKELVLKYLDKR